MACPLPIITTQRAMRENEPGTQLQVLVDNPLAAKNITTFLRDFGIEVQFQAQEEYLFTTFTNPNLPDEQLSSPVACPTPPEEEPEITHTAITKDSRPLLLCLSNQLGNGDPQLGEILIKGFLSTVEQWATLPTHIIFLNSGVRLTCEASGTIEALRKLQAKGVSIQSCGMCLDFYNLREKLEVGEISNMVQISTLISEFNRVIRI